TLAFWLAMEFRRDGNYQSRLFWVVLCVLQKSQPGCEAFGGGARIHSVGRRAARRSSASRGGCAPEIFTGSTESVGVGVGIRFVQLQFLFVADLAACVSFL